MRLSLGSKEQVARRKLHALSLANKITLTRDNDIDLVSVVGCLRVQARGSIPTHFQPGRIQDLFAESTFRHGQGID